MQKYLAALIMICLVPVLAMAGPGDQMGDNYFSHDNPKLTPEEQTGIGIADRWQTSSATGTKALAGNDGSVQFVFGVSTPSILCAVLQVCDVALQPGEQVNNINVGDPRWTVEPAITGSGANEVQHLIIKPQDVGLDTTLVVTTNARCFRSVTWPYSRENRSITSTWEIPGGPLSRPLQVPAQMRFSI